MGFLKRSTNHSILQNQTCFTGVSLTPKQYADTSKDVQQGKKADNFCPQCGYSLLECAIRNQQTDMINILLENGAAIFRNGDIERGIANMDALVRLGNKEIEGEFCYTSSNQARYKVWAAFSIAKRELSIYFGGEGRKAVMDTGDLTFAWGKVNFKHEGSFLWMEDGVQRSFLEPADPPYMGSTEIFNWFCNHVNQATPHIMVNQAIGFGDDGFDRAEIERAITASTQPPARPRPQPSAPPVPMDAEWFKDDDFDDGV